MAMPEMASASKTIVIRSILRPGVMVVMLFLRATKIRENCLEYLLNFLKSFEFWVLSFGWIFDFR